MGNLHLIKLCVGAATPEDLLDWQKRPQAQGPDGLPRHVTRVRPKRADEVLDGGSIYWVFKGVLMARQRILRMDEIDRGDGVLRCALVLDPEVVRTEARTRRPFQGWRYFAAADAPPDLGSARWSEAALPPALAAALADIGVR
ncbi:DUF1489 family protein [Roseitranquillus sediminis]|uniref:DUF1489 family protein n=1 Tax=Roseitranquillus sediminis TaxID=2809051 RepID=UPI001D0C701E|nr:DUF1489 domain-containing protein [Roseitranquillus sediminis]MBM9595926.1 DUF1489 domain-containing protein [Roseitranquillus sediminis]